MTVTGLCARLCEALAQSGVTRLGVAVSGGGDSMALLHLLADCARAQGLTLEAATVNHRLRAGADREARHVKNACEVLDIQHEILSWEGWDGRGNLQAAARRARYRLLGGWAGRRGLDRVALGHTMDDQAETVLMRLARAAGVDGLSAMAGQVRRDGALFWRPLLGATRAELRAELERRGVAWCEDPTNEDARFDRVKARRALDALAPLGIGAQQLAAVAANLAAAREALERAARETATQIAREDRGDIVFDEAGLMAAPDELRRRLVGAALVWVSGAGYKPRRAALAAFYPQGGGQRSLHGCLVIRDRKSLRIVREYNAVKRLRAPLGGLWDGRWRVTGPASAHTSVRSSGPATAPGNGPPLQEAEIRALGEGIRHCPGWRATGLPRASLMAGPAVWRGETLLAAPLAGFSAGYSAELLPPQGDFAASLQTH